MGRISAQEINVSRILSVVAAGFLVCWVTMWACAFWKRFSPDTAPRVVQLLVILLLFLSSAINPFIYAVTSRIFRAEFYKLLCWWKVRISPPEVNFEESAAQNEHNERKAQETET